MTRYFTDSPFERMMMDPDRRPEPDEPEEEEEDSDSDGDKGEQKQ